jgi:MoaA/NifB/PqqE/SkfB family radical SAM enzyme
LAKEKGVPFISMITNGNLLTESIINDCLSAGLDEIILSVHGVKKETYEFFMPNSNYDIFCRNLQIISDYRNKYNFKLRINYTINEDNVAELSDFFNVFGNLNIDVIQMRPISKFGETEYKNFSHDKIFENYDSSIQIVKDEAIKRNIICIAPTKNQMQITEGHNDNGVIYDATYCYICPKSAWKPDYDLDKETFKEYCKRRHWSWVLFQYIFISLNDMNRQKKQLNYNID